MHFLRIAAATAVGAMSLIATAAEPSKSGQPQDPMAAPPQLTYTSAFVNYRRSSDGEASPDKLWRQANADVALDGMEMSAPAGSSTPRGAAVPSSLDKPASGSSMPGHVGHQMTPEHATPAERPGAHQHEPSIQTPGARK